MKTILHFTLFLLVAVKAYGQTKQEELITGKPAKQAGRYARTITTDDLKKHVYVLAADSMEGRETGTRGQHKAAAYIRNHFQAVGLQPPVETDGQKSYFQHFELERQSMGETYIVLNGKKYLNLKDFIYTGDALKETQVKVPFVGIGSAADYVGKDVTSKAVLFLQNPKDDVEAIAKANGVNLEMLFSSDSTLVKRWLNSGYDFTNRLMFAAPASPKPFYNVFLTSELAAQMLQANTAELSKLRGKDSAATMTALLKNARPSSITIKGNKTIKKLPTENILGFIEGTDKKDEIVIVSAHYDHLGIAKSPVGDSIYNGADDDASGTSAVMEIAQAFARAKRKGHGPRRSLLFIAFTGEEQGLWGSTYYVEHPVLPLQQVVADLNIDMVGRTDSARKEKTDYLYVVGSDRLSSELHRLNEAVNGQRLKLEFDYTYSAKDHPEHIYERSDHFNFARKGVPIIFYYNGPHADYHGVADSADKIDYNLLQKRCQAIFYTAWELANRDERVKLDEKMAEAKKP